MGNVNKKSDNYSSIIEHRQSSKNDEESKQHESKLFPKEVSMHDKKFNDEKHPSTNNNEDEYNDESKYEYISNKEQFPSFINVALFSKSDDEYLEKLVDKAVLKLCYSKPFEKLWNDKEFIEWVYDDNKFPKAVNKVFDLMNSDRLDFFGTFVSTEFRRQINLHERDIEEQESEQKYETASLLFVEFDGEEYKINEKRQSYKNSNLSFNLFVNDPNNDFCWAVFDKSVRNYGGTETKGYWEIVEEETYDEKEHTNDKEIELQEIKSNSSDDNEEEKEMKNGKFTYIPFSHLNFIFELLQYHNLFSVKNNLDQHPKLIISPIYQAYCSDEGRSKEDSIKIRINNNYCYRLRFWNQKERNNCNSISIFVGDEEREYFYMRFKHKSKSIIWDYYDNNAEKYNKYPCGDNNIVYKELEATFQANLNENFPQHVFNPSGTNIIHMFNVCILPKLEKHYQNQSTFIMRFTFAETANRISQIEHLLLTRQNGKFQETDIRNVRRLVNGQNSLQIYWQNRNAFIEEWKKRYLLSSPQQQLYFWCYILSISTIIKYIEIEFQHQMISFPNLKNKKSVLGGKKKYQMEKTCDSGKFKGLDDSRLQRHKIDYQLYDGFFVPPTNRLQTTAISKNMKQINMINKYDKWYEILSHVESLTKFICQEELPLDYKNGCKPFSANDEQKEHKYKIGDTLWISTQKRLYYCDKCSSLLRFSECIRKYVLETENNQVVHFLWPWYRNYFHGGDSKKYLKYIAECNLSHLFLASDIYNLTSKEDEIKQFLRRINMMRYYKKIKNYPVTDLDELHKYNEKDLEKKLNIEHYTHRKEILKELKKLGKVEHIRHFRKFAGSVLLGPWDILRNINVIKHQLQLIFNDEKYDITTWKQWKKEINAKNQLHGQRSNMETILELSDVQQVIFSSLVKAILNDVNKETLDVRNEERYYVHFKESFHKTPQWWSVEHDILLLELSLKFNWNANGINEELINPSKKWDYQQLLGEEKEVYKNDTEISEDRKESDKVEEDNDVSNMINILQNVDFGTLDSHRKIIIQWFKLNDIGHAKFKTLNRKDFADEIANKCNDKKLTGPSAKLFNNISTKISIEIEVQNKDEKTQDSKEEKIDYNELEEKTVDTNYDIIREKEKKKEVYFSYRGYDEFQVWCQNWRNIQHRLRYLTFTICRHLNECNPSIIEKRIPRPQDRVPQYDINSFIFLNGYIKQVHLENCTEIAQNDIDDHRLHNNNPFHSQVFTRDPFMERDLDFELEQICQSFDLLRFGVEFAKFLIKLLASKRVESLWTALGITLEYMPYEDALFVLSMFREDLRHGSPQQVKCLCDRIRRGAGFDVHICLFLSEYMKNNAEQDLARFQEWIEFSKYYEDVAGETINQIQSDHLLSILLEIPMDMLGKTRGEAKSLLQLALEQNRSQFLNNERINAVLTHVWQTPTALDPNAEILRKPFTNTETYQLLLDKPYHFYLTPMGLDLTIKSMHLLYLLSLFIFISNRIYLDDPIPHFEWFLWTLNISYVAYETREAYNVGLRDYLTIAGVQNYWDVQISFTFLILFIIRMSSFVSMYSNENVYANDHESSTPWILSQIYSVLWAVQITSFSARSLLLFRTSKYFGVLLRMMGILIVEMGKFMLVLGLILVGFVFGLYYIQGVYDSEHKSSVEDWYYGFRYLFQLAVAAGDFAEIETIFGDQISIQLFTILYIVFATILMMNLLIALMTTAYSNAHSDVRTASAFSIAETTFDLSRKSRIMPGATCIYVIVFAIIVHIINFIPALLFPKTCNIYNCVNHYQYTGFVKWKLSVNCDENKFICRKGACTPKSEERFFLCCKTLKVKENENVTRHKDVYRLTTRGRVWKYYASTFFLWSACTPKVVQKVKKKFEIHHTGCYSCIPTESGAKDTDKDRSTCHGITLNEYIEEYENHHNSSLDPLDTVLLEHLTVDILFCKYCYKPFHPRKLDDVLLTPFDAMLELISIYLFPLTVWIPLIIFFGLLGLFENIWNSFTSYVDRANVIDHDRRYFAKPTLRLSANEQEEK